MQGEEIKMGIEAIIHYRGYYACYRIKKEAENIYLANLKRYDGGVHDFPPVTITLTKGIRHWIGSSHINDLLQDLGEIIDFNAHCFELNPEMNKDMNAVEEE
jgi:hypothetical protein